MSNRGKIKRSTKFIREYGMTLKALSERYHCTVYHLWVRHIQNRLHHFIKKQEECGKVWIEECAEIKKEDFEKCLGQGKRYTETGNINEFTR